MLSELGFDQSIFPTFLSQTCPVHGNVEYPSAHWPFIGSAAIIPVHLEQPSVLHTAAANHLTWATILFRENNNMSKQTYADLVRRLHKLRQFSATCRLHFPLAHSAAFYNLDDTVCFRMRYALQGHLYPIHLALVTGVCRGEEPPAYNSSLLPENNSSNI